MGGTTLCPHCNTRFRVAEAQLESHQGMVRCGHCLQAFDARPEFIPDQPDPQLELPMLDEPAGHLSPDEALAPETSAEAPHPAEEKQPAEPVELPHHDLLDFSQPSPVYVEATNETAITHPADEAVPQTLAEQVAIVPDEEPAIQPKRRTWPWAIAALLLLLVLLVQAAYFFRVDLAAHMPGLKPALVGSCQLFGCTVPLPQKTELVSIESSNLEADPAHDNQIVLNALLRNRAPYAQAFPNLELTLNDTQDKPLARRTFRPVDYLKVREDEKQGLAANRDLDIKLHLDTTDLKPSGYRLVLFYPQ
ncbi:MAG: zinc-ribbon and DUF3426 domain-containing protein [Gallionellaceae bacterium]